MKRREPTVSLFLAGKLTEDLLKAGKAVIDEYQRRLEMCGADAQRKAVVSIQNG